MVQRFRVLGFRIRMSGLGLRLVEVGWTTRRRSVFEYVEAFRLGRVLCL